MWRAPVSFLLSRQRRSGVKAKVRCHLLPSTQGWHPRAAGKHCWALLAVHALCERGRAMHEGSGPSAARLPRRLPSQECFACWWLLLLLLVLKPARDVRGKAFKAACPQEDTHFPQMKPALMLSFLMLIFFTRCPDLRVQKQLLCSFCTPEQFRFWKQ